MRFTVEFADRVCHFFVRAGQWEFLTDSTHARAGQTVPCAPTPTPVADRGGHRRNDPPPRPHADPPRGDRRRHHLRPRPRVGPRLDRDPRRMVRRHHGPRDRLRGRWPTVAQIARAERAQRAPERYPRPPHRRRPRRPGPDPRGRPHRDGAAPEWHARLIASQMPAPAGTQVDLVARFNRVDPLHSKRSSPAPPSRSPASRCPVRGRHGQRQAELIRGIAVGDNPRRPPPGWSPASRAPSTGASTGPWDRPHRDVGRAPGRRRAAGLRERRRHGRVDVGRDPRHPHLPVVLGDARHRLRPRVPGPYDHQQGRCARLPRTKSWRELGFDLDEPASLLPDAETVFEALPADDQLAIMGGVRLELLRPGGRRGGPVVAPVDVGVAGLVRAYSGAGPGRGVTSRRPPHTVHRSSTWAPRPASASPVVRQS